MENTRDLLKCVKLNLCGRFCCYIFDIVLTINVLDLTRLPVFAVNKTNFQLPTHSYFLIIRSKNGDTGVEKAQVYRRRSLQG